MCCQGKYETEWLPAFLKKRKKDTQMVKMDAFYSDEPTQCAHFQQICLWLATKRRTGRYLTWNDENCDAAYLWSLADEWYNPGWLALKIKISISILIEWVLKIKISISNVVDRVLKIKISISIVVDWALKTKYQYLSWLSGRKKTKYQHRSWLTGR